MNWSREALSVAAWSAAIGAVAPRLDCDCGCGSCFFFQVEVPSPPPTDVWRRFAAGSNFIFAVQLSNLSMRRRGDAWLHAAPPLCKHWTPKGKRVSGGGSPRCL
mmetsp:Transcript_38276/g.85880  ORF Transcript_38276/g.85880 Transcript_38276/m.85880 type:complete len:104 (+) Transcript_38276:183-494(+)